MAYLRRASVLLGFYLNLNGLYLVSAVKLSGSEVINLGHKSTVWEPLMHISANLSSISSITSHFEFRTLDPEGIVFYGDTKEGQDWFVLSLRDGVPEVQIGKANVLVSVKGGPKLDDGVWHKLELRSEGKYVVVEIDNKVELVVGMESDQTDDVLTGKIRLALGGMLVDQKRLLHPFDPEMDACIRAGSWLNLSTPWDTEPNWKPSTCFAEIKRGSYFPGSGLALFNTSDLPGVETEERGVTIEVYGSWHGMLFSLQSLDFQYILPRDEGKENRALSVELKEESGSSDSADPSKLTLTLLRHSLVLNGETELQNESIDFLTRWTEGMSLAFGGVPGEPEDSPSTHRLQGCLEKILIQGKDIDLDWAFFKHSSISSHSCPAKAVNELTEMYLLILQTQAFITREIMVNDPLNLQCTCSENCPEVRWSRFIPKRADVAWILVCPDEQRREKRFLFSGDTGRGNFSLMISSVAYNDAGSYRCSCNGKSVTEVKLRVFVPTVVKAFEGENITLPCYGDTRRDVKDLKWKKAGQKLSDAGLYQCLIHDESQDGEPPAVLLKVEGLQPTTNSSGGVSISCVLLGLIVSVGLIIFIIFIIYIIRKFSKCAEVDKEPDSNTKSKSRVILLENDW